MSVIQPRKSGKNGKVLIIIIVARFVVPDGNLTIRTLSKTRHFM